jgi:hypothetical protein
MLLLLLDQLTKNKLKILRILFIKRTLCAIIKTSSNSLTEDKMNTEANSHEVNILTRYSKIIAKLSAIKSLDIKEVQSEAWLLLAEFDPAIVVTDQLFERKLLQSVTDLVKSCGLGRGSKWGCVTSLTAEDRSTLEIGAIANIPFVRGTKASSINGPQKGCHVFPSANIDSGAVTEFGESAEDVFFEKRRIETLIAELPDRTRQLLETLETALTGREIMEKHGSRLGVQCLSVLNRRIAKETALACEETSQASLF